MLLVQEAGEITYPHGLAPEFCPQVIDEFWGWSPRCLFIASPPGWWQGVRQSCRPEGLVSCDKQHSISGDNEFRYLLNR